MTYCYMLVLRPRQGLEILQLPLCNRTSPCTDWADAINLLFSRSERNVLRGNTDHNIASEQEKLKFTSVFFEDLS